MDVLPRDVYNLYVTMELEIGNLNFSDFFCTENSKHEEFNIENPFGPIH